MCGTLTSTVHLKLHTEEPGPFPVEDGLRFVGMVMDKLLLIHGVEAVGTVRAFVVFVGVFIASLTFPEYAAALSACGVAPFVAILAQRGTGVPCVIIPP